MHIFSYSSFASLNTFKCLNLSIHIIQVLQVLIVNYRASVKPKSVAALG